MVILGDDNALNYLDSRFSKRVTPVVYLCINNNPRNYQLHNSKNITGVLERPLIKRSISSISYGKAKKFLLVFDNSPTSKTIIKENFSNKNQVIISGVQVDIKLINDWNSWKTQILSSSELQYDILFIGLYQTIIGQENRHVPAPEVLSWTINNTPIPPFFFWEFSIGKEKAIGGLVMFGFEQGKLAAQMAKQMLEEGISPYKLGIKTAEKGRFVFSRKQLERFSVELPQRIIKNATFIN